MSRAVIGMTTDPVIRNSRMKVATAMRQRVGEPLRDGVLEVGQESGRSGSPDEWVDTRRDGVGGDDESPTSLSHQSEAPEGPGQGQAVEPLGDGAPRRELQLLHRPASPRTQAATNPAAAITRS